MKKQRRSIRVVSSLVIVLAVCVGGRLNWVAGESSRRQLARGGCGRQHTHTATSALSLSLSLRDGDGGGMFYSEGLADRAKKYIGAKFHWPWQQPSPGSFAAAAATSNDTNGYGLARTRTEWWWWWCNGSAIAAAVAAVEKIPWNTIEIRRHEFTWRTKNGQTNAFLSFYLKELNKTNKDATFIFFFLFFF